MYEPFGHESVVIVCCWPRSSKFRSQLRGIRIPPSPSTGTRCRFPQLQHFSIAKVHFVRTRVALIKIQEPKCIQIRRIHSSSPSFSDNLISRLISWAWTWRSADGTWSLLGITWISGTWSWFDTSDCFPGPKANWNWPLTPESSRSAWVCVLQRLRVRIDALWDSEAGGLVISDHRLPNGWDEPCRRIVFDGNFLAFARGNEILFPHENCARNHEIGVLSHGAKASDCFYH